MPTVWIEPIPGHENEPRAVPIGLRHLPAPGEAVLSPGLVGEGYTAEDFGWKTSDAGTQPDGAIGPDGVMTQTERLIFVRPDATRTLTASSVEWYVAGFGMPPTTYDVAYAGDPEFLPPRHMALGSLAFLIIPAAVLLISGARARSSLREHRMRFLVGLGVAAWRARALVAMETALLAGVGAGVATMLWGLLSPRLVDIPLSGVRAMPGSFTLPWPMLGALAVAVTALAAVVGSTGRLTPGRERHRRPLVARLALGVLTISCVSLIAAASIPLRIGDSREINALVIAAATFTVLISTPLAMPQIIAWAGRACAFSRSPTLWATGRRMHAQPYHLSRVGSVLAVLIVLLSSGSALGLSSVRADDEASSPVLVHGTTISWVDAQDGDTQQVAARLQSGSTPVLTLPLVEVPAGPEGEGDVPPAVLLDNCQHVIDALQLSDSESCESAEGTHRIGEHLGVHVVAPSDATGRVVTNGVAIFAAGELPIENVQQELGFLPGLNISADRALAYAPLPIHHWLAAALAGVVVLVGTAALREIGDRNLDDVERDETLRKIGVSDHAINQLGWVTLLVPLLISTLTAALLSGIITYAGQSIHLMFQEPLRLIVIAVSSLGAALLAVVASLPIRKALRRAKALG